MKNVIKLTIFTAFFGIFIFVACKKEQETESPSAEKSSVVEQLVKDHTYRLNLDPLEALVQNPDKEVDFINKSNVEIAKVLTSLVTREDFNQFVVETARANDGNVYYEQIFTKFSDLEPLFQNTIIGRRGKNKSFRTSDGQDYDFVHNDIAYQTMIFVPNAAVCRPSDQSITSPEIQIPRETGEGDIYFAWEVKKDKPKKEINIIEREAMSTTTPVMMTSLRHIAFLKSPKVTNSPNEPKFIVGKDTNKNQLQTRGAYDNSVWVRKANLLFNYDGGTNSELRVNAAWIANNGSALGWARPNKPEFEVGSHSQTCALIGTNGDNQFMQYDLSFIWQSRKYFFNAWEYDWGSSDRVQFKITRPIFLICL